MMDSCMVVLAAVAGLRQVCVCVSVYVSMSASICLLVCHKGIRCTRAP